MSAFHPEVSGYKVGQHPIVQRLLQGAFNKRPPQPRYTVTWDVDKVLQLLRSWGPNSVLSTSCLTHKLAMLMALTSAR